jgi:hypothetical protein
MDTVSDVFSEFKKTSAFADALGLKLSAASEMRRRNSIPVRYWPRLVEAARERGIDGISYEKLVEMHTPLTADEAAS